MTVYNIHEAKTHFSKLMELVLRGEEVIIAKAGKPLARILPFVKEDVTERKPGIDKGKVIIKPDFDAPLEEFNL
jgi:prevent-host-death family protein